MASMLSPQSARKPGDNDNRPQWETAQKLLDRARKFPAAENGLLMPEHIMYSNAWRDVVNPSSGRIAVAYNAIGPDISTILLSTDPGLVYGMDMNPVDIRRLDWFISRWDIVDTASAALGPVSQKFLLPEIRGKPHCPELDELFVAMLDGRMRKGFWEFSEIDTWSVERAMAIELKRLGVDPATIALTGTDGNARLDFSWGYPGQEPTARTFIFLRGFAYEIFERTRPSDLRLDGFYQKAAHVFTDTASIPLVPDYLTANGFALIGGPALKFCDSRAMDLLGPGFRRISVPYAITQIIESAMSGLNGSLSTYGWKLEGAKGSGSDVQCDRYDAHESLERPED